MNIYLNQHRVFLTAKWSPRWGYESSFQVRSSCGTPEFHAPVRRVDGVVLARDVNHWVYLGQSMVIRSLMRYRRIVKYWMKLFSVFDYWMILGGGIGVPLYDWNTVHYIVC